MNIINIGNIGIGKGCINAQQFEDKLAQASNEEKVYLDFHSEGGSVIEGFRMFNAINQFKGRTVARIRAAAFSIASYLAMACDEVEISENGYLMIHNPYTGLDQADADALAQNADLLRDMQNKMVLAYSTKTGLTEDQVTAMMKETTYLNAARAVALGFADRVIDSHKATPTKTVSARLPIHVFASLYNELPSTPEDDQMKVETTPTAAVQAPKHATVKEIKKRYPQARDAFIVKCMDEEMTMDEVDAEMSDDLAAENEQLKARIAELEAQLADLMPDEEPVVAEEDMPVEEEPTARVHRTPVAKPRAKQQPAPLGGRAVARVAGNSIKVPVRQRWDELVGSFKAKGMDTMAAIRAANKANPALRQELLAAANPNQIIQ